LEGPVPCCLDRPTQRGSPVDPRLRVSLWSRYRTHSMTASWISRARLPTGSSLPGRDLCINRALSAVCRRRWVPVSRTSLQNLKSWHRKHRTSAARTPDFISERLMGDLWQVESILVLSKVIVLAFRNVGQIQGNPCNASANQPIRRSSIRTSPSMLSMCMTRHSSVRILTPPPFGYIGVSFSTPATAFPRKKAD